MTQTAQRRTASLLPAVLTIAGLVSCAARPALPDQLYQYSCRGDFHTSEGPFPKDEQVLVAVSMADEWITLTYGDGSRLVLCATDALPCESKYFSYSQVTAIAANDSLHVVVNLLVGARPRLAVRTNGSRFGTSWWSSFNGDCSAG